MSDSSKLFLLLAGVIVLGFLVNRLSRHYPLGVSSLLFGTTLGLAFLAYVNHHERKKYERLFEELVRHSYQTEHKKEAPVGGPELDHLKQKVEDSLSTGVNNHF